jgi:hypothetical protein
MAKILYMGTAGSDDPTRVGLPFNFALGGGRVELAETEGGLFQSRDQE